MNFDGFCGASYQSLSQYASIERSVNFYPEVIEDPNEKKARVVLYPTPCTGAYSQVLLPSDVNAYGISRGLLELNGILIGVNAGNLFRFDPPSVVPPTGRFTAQGTIVSDGLPVSMIANGVTTAHQHVMITSANHGYIYEPLVGLLHDLAAVPGFLAGNGCTFLDDYFISLIPGTNGFQISGLNDGLSWDAADVAYVQGQSDILVNLIADREYLWLFGNRRGQIWYNQGGQFFPFAIQPGAFLETGLQARNTLIQADNSIFWLGQDKRGGTVAYRSNGLIPQRVSNHAVETAWQSYAKNSTVNDCISYSFVWDGHIFVRYIFPTAQAGWTYDATASRTLGYSVWHENTFTDNLGNTFAPLERSHAYFQGLHVVGSGGVDGRPGTLYTYTNQTLLPANPVLLLRLSRDGGETFGPEYQLPVGQAGNFDIRVIKNLLGVARDAVFWVRCVDFGDAGIGFGQIGGLFPIVRDRICPHQFSENKYVTYERFEVALKKGIGFLGGEADQFWALVAAYLTAHVNSA